MINSMVNELIRAVNYFPGNCQKPIKLEILATVDVDSLTVIGFMRKGLGCRCAAVPSHKTYTFYEKRWLILPFIVLSCL